MTAPKLTERTFAASCGCVLIVDYGPDIYPDRSCRGDGGGGLACATAWAECAIAFRDRDALAVNETILRLRAERDAALAEVARLRALPELRPSAALEYATKPREP